MTEYFIGTGGWAYFKVPNKPSLKAYSELFNFVEVNSTFYEYPDLKTVEGWRRRVPKSFTFTVRCHQDLTHRIGLKPVDEAYAVFSQMIAICRILNAPFLHLLTPAGTVFTDSKTEQAREFLSSINQKGVRLAWEPRSPATPKLLNLMHDFDVVHSVDLSKEISSQKSDTVYARLFGKGEHNIYQFTDQELKEVDDKITKLEPKMAIITFHGLRMNTDAARFKRYRETGKFMPVTEYIGIASARAVLLEDVKFPTTKTELIKHQGWKVIDMTADNRVHLSELLTKIPEKAYNTMHEVIEELEAVL